MQPVVGIEPDFDASLVPEHGGSHRRSKNCPDLFGIHPSDDVTALDRLQDRGRKFGVCGEIFIDSESRTPGQGDVDAGRDECRATGCVFTLSLR